jgi:hypothetical protein
VIHAAAGAQRPPPRGQNETKRTENSRRVRPARAIVITSDARFRTDLRDAMAFAPDCRGRSGIPRIVRSDQGSPMRHIHRYCLRAFAAFGVVAGGVSVDGDAHAATLTAAPAITTSLPQGGFEAPNLAAGSWGYAATINTLGGPWTFTTNAGIATNSSVWYSVPAPEGDQVAFVQNGGTFSQAFTASGGRYRVRFQSAQRRQLGNPTLPQNQTLSVRVDGVEIASVTPSGLAFAAYTTPSLDLSLGTHTLTFAGMNTATDNTALVDAVELVAIPYLAEGGFEVPNRPIPSYQYNQTGSAWTFDGGAGVATNGSGWTNSPAPEGDQFAFLQGGSNTIVRQAFKTSAGRYRLSLKAAQRIVNNIINNQTIAVTIDGYEVGRITPASTDFSTFQFDALSLGAGMHTLEFVGQNGIGDHSAFIDDVSLVPTLAGARRWSDPATWGGVLPKSGDTVVIPAGAVVELDSDIVYNPNGTLDVNASNGHVTAINVHGELHCADEDIALSAESVMVHGRFVCGSPYSRHVNNFTLTLRGTKNATSGDDMGNKVLAAMGSGALIELHGELRKSWTQLAQTANVGANQLTLVAQTDWRVGDTLVVAPSSTTPGDGEVVTITSVNPQGNVVGISPTLTRRHYGASSTYSNGTTSWTLDERAEVGLLSRNIKIQGDAASSSTQFGGHMMTMVGTTIHASGIELYRMGQKGIKARYPFHWHLVGDAPGQYIENSSVHESYNRCITVHQTNRTRVADNVCYDFIGHGYFLEDGNEQFNVFDRNLGIWGKRPAAADAILDTDYRDSPASNGPAVFWISHPNNTYTNNAAAGSEGSGYWYHLETTGPGGVTPNTATFGKFDNNRVHSGRQGFTSCREAGNGFGMDSQNVLIERLTVSQVGQGIWPCSLNTLVTHTVFKNTITANTENGMQSPAPMTFKDSVFVAYSANEPARAAATADVAWNAIPVYDQGFILDNVHFVNYDRPQMSVFSPVGGAFKLPNNRVKGLTFDHSPNVFLDLVDYWELGQSPTLWGEPIYDLDGSLVGAPGHSMTSTHPLMTDATCKRPANAGFRGYACPYRFAQFRIDTPLTIDEVGHGGADPVTILRSDGVSDTVAHEPFKERFMHAFIANASAPYRYAYRYVGGIPRKNLWPMVVWGRPGDASVHEIMDVPSGFTVTDSDWTAANSVQDLIDGAGNRYFYRQDAASLLLKFVAPATQPDWNTLDGLSICLVPLEAGHCPFGSRNPQSPSVEITSPVRTATGSGSFTITANATANVGTLSSVALFVDEQPVGSPLSSPPFQFAVSRTTAGVRNVRVVAKNTAGATYTAIQRLVIGEPEPRIEITNIADNGTYTPASFPATLSYNAINPPAGSHVRWIFDEQDRGAATGGSIPVSATLLTQGRHDITVAYANADGSIRAIVARKRIYVVAANDLADFEDGRDWRVTFTPHGANAKPAPFGYAWGVRSTSRIDGQDDMNYFDRRYVDGSGNPAKTRLTLTPQQNWNAYQQVEVVHAGPGFSLHLLRAGGTETQLTWTGNAGSSSFFNLPAGSKSDVVGLEMREAEPLASTCAATPTLQNVCSFRRHLHGIRLIP